MFDSKQLSAIAYCNGFTLWHYRTPDSLATVTGHEYFKVAFGMLRHGDLLILHAHDAPDRNAEFSFLTVGKDDQGALRVRQAFAVTHNQPANNPA